MEAVLARYLLLLLAAAMLFCAPARAATAPAPCSGVREGQAGVPAALASFLADAQDAMLWICRHDSATGPQASYELRGPRRREGGVCAFDAIAVTTPVRPARDLLADLPRAHMIYMRPATAACPAQDDPSYTQTQAQFGVGYAEQFLGAIRSWARLRAAPEAFAAQLSGPRSAPFTAMLARNRNLPLRVVRMTTEEPSWRTVLNEPRVTLSIEAPEDPVAGVTYTLTLEPLLDGFDVIEAGVAR
jgi:hypothetical protein